MKQINPLTTDLSAWSHIKIGAKCRNFFLPADAEELAAALNFAQEKGLKILPLAGGSNILFGNLNDIAVISDAKLPCYWENDGEMVTVSGNYNINRLLMKIARINLSGLEFLAGIPAHIAGLVNMNAGAFGSQISDFIESVIVIDATGERRSLRKSEIHFDYRHTSITDYITEVQFSLKPLPEDEILKIIKFNIEERRQKQPLNLPNLGCIFKNPPDISAGYLLDKSGLKGKRRGNAAFSEIHANFMVNLGNATFEDAWNLIQTARICVKENFGIDLELEIRIIDS